MWFSCWRDVLNEVMIWDTKLVLKFVWLLNVWSVFSQQNLRCNFNIESQAIKFVLFSRV